MTRVNRNDFPLQFVHNDIVNIFEMRCAREIHNPFIVTHAGQPLCRWHAAAGREMVGKTGGQARNTNLPGRFGGALKSVDANVGGLVQL